MANQNKSAILGAIYNEGDAQILEGTQKFPTEILVNGHKVKFTYGKTPELITAITIDGVKHTCSYVCNKKDACTHVHAWFTNNVESDVITYKNGKYYKNGTKVNVLDIFKGVPVHKVIEILDDSKKDVKYYEMASWLYDATNRNNYLKTLFPEYGLNAWFGYLKLEYYFQTGETYSTMDNLFEVWEDLADEWDSMELIGV